MRWDTKPDNRIRIFRPEGDWINVAFCP